MKTLCGSLEQSPSGIVQFTRAFECATVESGIEATGAAGPLQLAFARRQNASANNGGRFAFVLSNQVADRNRLDIDDQIDPIEQGAGQAPSVG